MDTLSNLLQMEEKWRNEWQEKRAYEAAFPDERPKRYLLDMFPHPSAAGLSVAHCRNFVGTDVFARFSRAQGYNVLYPMGWDAFGITAEKEARQRGIPPAEVIREHAAKYQKQMQRLGLSYDWSRSLNTSDPGYYRWTQWFFQLLYRRGLIYAESHVRTWCAHCAKVLRAVEVDERERCCRCGRSTSQIISREWFVRITAYTAKLDRTLDALDWPAAMKKMQRHWLSQLRDWSISRRRYWGTPLPLIHCPTCGVQLAPELPVRLPSLAGGPLPTDLAQVPGFCDTICPQCGEPARRDEHVLSVMFDSAWHFLRFAVPDSEQFPFAGEAAAYWMPVDLLVGGAEQTNFGLLYARFAGMVLAEAGYLSQTEPFPRFAQQGVVHGHNHQRMTKSKNNVVKIKTLIDRYGADACRWYLLSLADNGSSIDWKNHDPALRGAHKWLRRVVYLSQLYPTPADAVAQSLTLPPDDITLQFLPLLHEAITQFHLYHYMVELMALIKALRREAHASRPESWRWAGTLSILLRLLAPVAPHLAEELWQQRGFAGSIHQQPWPVQAHAIIGNPPHAGL